jgi:2-polyprenyl-3-methyl-5-hydroxy-6-metoxy-1,4-benzoquinol methylase
MKIRNFENQKHYENQQLSRNGFSIEHLSIEKIKSYLPIDKKSNIIDIGCRSGKTIQALIRMGYENAYGMDLGDSTWSSLQDNVKKNFIKNDIHNGIPLDCKFDLILCSHMLEHVHDPVKVINEFKSKLSNEGVLYISVPLDYNEIGMRHTPHYTFFESTDDLKEFLEKNEFEVIESKTNTDGPGGILEAVCFAKLKI